MRSNLFLNGVPMIWITADENPSTGNLEASISKFCKDYLIPADKFDGSIPSDYFDRV